ncbi:SHOCT domain-containing protein [Halorarius halobius]|uniref:SHOCT domain-containing protein n=1 Tax=Halorarius halobius TaxID=2962671 RepID=UPI0020CC24C7|nr:SHOCT domain-containing protein [Halorarius halobius]
MDQILGQRTGTLFVATAVLLVAFGIAVTGPVAAHTGDDGFHHHDGWMGSHGWAGGGTVGALWMTLWTLVLVGVPLGLGYLLFARRGSGGETTDDALTTLRRRYAEGAIDEEEFDARRRKLQGGE